MVRRTWPAAAVQTPGFPGLPSVGRGRETEGGRGLSDSDPDREPSLDALRHRLSEAKAKHERSRRAPKGSIERSEGMAAGFRVAVELTAALVVGGGIGYVLDQWLGTQPWLLILFFVIGAAAGFLTIYRTGQELDARARERREAEAAEQKAKTDRKGSDR